MVCHSEAFSIFMSSCVKDVVGNPDVVVNSTHPFSISVIVKIIIAVTPL